MERTQTRGLTRLAGALIAMSLVAGACGASTGAPATTSTTATSLQPKAGGELRVLLIQDASRGYDPAKTNESTAYVIDEQMYDTLVQPTPDGSGKVVPNLAESWTIAPDGLTYTFKLRKGVKFHNGREMVADDVKYTIDRLKDPKTASPRLQSFAGITVEAPDAYTAVFKLKEPFAPLVATLSQINSAIVPKEAAEAPGDLTKKPVGTGPFKFVEWVADQRFVVEKNPTYWKANIPYLDRVVFTFNSDENARAAALRAGNVDFLFQAPSSQVDILKRDSNLNVVGGEGTTSWLYFQMNGQKEPFKDVKVRQAVYTILDRQALADIGRPGTSAVLNCGFVPTKFAAGLKEPCYKTDLAKAKQLLTEAGVPNGFKFTINALTGWDFQIRTAQGIQQQLKPLGIEAEVKIVDSATITGQARDGSFQAMVLGFSGTIDPDERFQQSFVTGGGANWGKMTDKQVDELVAQARRSSDQDQRNQLYIQAQKRVAEVGNYAFLYNYFNFDAMQKYVKGYTWDPSPSYDHLRNVWLDKP